MHKTEDDLQQLQQRWEQKPPPHGALTAALEASRSFTARGAVRSPWLTDVAFLSPAHTHTGRAHSSSFQTIHFTSKVTPCGTKNEAAKC